jgi:hypothetical protein
LADLVTAAELLDLVPGILLKLGVRPEVVAESRVQWSGDGQELHVAVDGRLLTIPASHLRAEP